MPLLTLRQAAARFPQLTCGSLAKQAQRGNIPFTKRYGYFHFKEKDVKALVKHLAARQARYATPEPPVN